MNCKYKKAISDYAYWGSEVKKLTHEINKASSYEREAEAGDFVSSCEGGGKEDCIKMLWDTNIQIMIDKESDNGYLDGDYDNIELCESCQKIQVLVDQRKLAKKKFGISKRAITLLGNKLIQQQKTP